MNSIAKKVSEITVNAIGDREELKIAHHCWGLEVRQKITDTPMLIFKTSDVASGGVAEEHSAGTAAFYYPNREGRNMYGVGETVGFIETASSSATFQLIHYLSPRNT